MKEKDFLSGMAVCRLVPASMLLALATTAAMALDPTELQTASGMEGKTFELQQKVKLDEFEGSEWRGETSLEYELTERWAIRLKLPYTFSAEDEEEGIDDLELRLKHVFNPESNSGFVVGATAALTLPMGEDSEGLGADLRLRLSRWDLGKSDKHGIHATLIGKFDGDDSDDDHWFWEDNTDERDFRFEGVVGYTYQATASTRLILDTVYEQSEEEGKDEYLVEAGVSHSFNDAITAALGVGAGLDGDSPDYVARAGIQFRF